MNDQPDRLKRFAFECYDYNDDGFIQDLDLYTYLQNFKDNEELMSKVFIPDILVLT
jgi:Ca2+-binding EF-hand superfamily protein